MLKCINHVLKPKVGTVIIDGKSISSLSRREIARIMGVIPQNESILYPHTVLDVVLMGREPYLGRFNDLSRLDICVVEEAMRVTNITHLAERTVKELSSGEFQRVLIARALAQQPKVLLLDEPTSHLDVNYQLELIREMTENRKLITIMTTHDLNISLFLTSNSSTGNIM